VTIYNQNATDVVANATDTYLTGSSLAIVNRVQIGTRLRWRLAATKTSAGTAVPAWSMRFGAGATVTDAARCAVTGTAQTALTDFAVFTIDAVLRATGATCVVQSNWQQEHSNTVSGFQNIAQTVIRQALSTGFDVTVASIKAGLSVNPGTAGVWTFQVIEATAENVI
jgi:hypothetical protein